MTGRTPPPLRRLDDRWLPRVAAGLQAATGLVRRWSRTHAVRTAIDAVRANSPLTGSIVAVLVAGVLLATVGEPGAGPGDGDGEHPGPAPSAAVATVGPTPGASVPTYLSRAAFNLRHFGEVSAGRATYAVVDLRAYTSPARVRALFAGTTVVRAYVRVPAGKVPTLVRSVPLRGLDGLSTGLRTASSVARATANSYAALLRALHPRTAADRAVKQRYRQQWRAARREAAELSRPETCRCVFSVVVRGTAVQLGRLARLPAARAVDPAPPAIELTGLTVLPLLPEVTRVVPGGGLPRG